MELAIYFEGLIISQNTNKTVRNLMGLSSRKRKSSGQGLVEFALVIIVLFMVIFGALVLGQLFHTRVVLNNAAREGARYLSIHPTDNQASFAGTKAAAVLEATNSGVGVTDSDVTVGPGCNVDPITNFCESGSPVEVKVATTVTLAWQWLFPSSIALEGSATMIVQ